MLLAPHVLSKRRKGEGHRLCLSGSIAVEQGKKDLMKEYEESIKSSIFVDQRIEEKDGSLEEFEKAVLRIHRERQVNRRILRWSRLTSIRGGIPFPSNFISGDLDIIATEICGDDERQNPPISTPNQSPNSSLVALDIDERQNSSIPLNFPFMTKRRTGLGDLPLIYVTSTDRL